MEGKRYDIKGEDGTYGVFVTNQTPIEIELWNNIEKLVDLKKDIPDLDAGRMILLIESEIGRIRKKQKETENNQYNSSKITLEAFKKKQQERKPIENNNTLYKLDNKRAQGKYSSQYENNPWGIHVNTNVLCEKCNEMSVLGLAVHHDDGATIVYKVFEHPDGQRNQHFVRLKKFDGGLSYKQIQRTENKK